MQPEIFTFLDKISKIIKIFKATINSVKVYSNSSINSLLQINVTYFCKKDSYSKQEESARERALCQLTECF